MIKYFIGGNWKCNGNKNSIKTLCQIINSIDKKNIDIVILPSFLHIQYMVENCNKVIGSQNCSSNNDGAFTGEVSTSMLKDIGCQYVLVGHSERRNILDNDNMIINKIKQILDNNLKIILCIGENIEDKNNNKTVDILANQLIQILTKFNNKLNYNNLVIAYEPVWAIGTGMTSTPEYAQNIHREIRKMLAYFNLDNCRIIYGGSVKSKNCIELIKQNDINGFLIGGASLNKDFKNIINLI